MTAIILISLFFQALGALVGIGAAIWAELSYLHAMRDGNLDAAERAHLIAIGRGLRFGMMILLLSTFGIVVAAYAYHLEPQPALTASYWLITLFSLLVIAISWALSRRHISFALGSAAALTAWWLLAYIVLGQLPISFGATVALYVVLTAVIYAVLRLVRSFVLSRIRP